MIPPIVWAVVQQQPDIKQRLEKIAAARDISVSSVLRLALAEFLSKNDNEDENVLLQLDAAIKRAKIKTAQELDKVFTDAGLPVQPGTLAAVDEGGQWVSNFEI